MAVWTGDELAEGETAIELFPLGRIVLVDSTVNRGVSNPIDAALIVTGPRGWGADEERLLVRVEGLNVPIIAMLDPTPGRYHTSYLTANLRMRGIPCIVGNDSHNCAMDLAEALVDVAPTQSLGALPLGAELASSGDVVILVVPMDIVAPKGRLFTEQVECIRDLLDNDVCCMVVTELELRQALRALSQPPSLIVTAPHAFPKLATDIDRSVPMTTYSVLLSRTHADLMEFVKGAIAIEHLTAGARVLICETKKLRRKIDTIGRSEIPRLLQRRIGGNLEFTHCDAAQFPDSVNGYDLVIHSDSTAISRRTMLGHIIRCRRADVPITNYGMAIAYTQRLFERALRPFSGALEPYWEAKLRA